MAEQLINNQISTFNQIVRLDINFKKTSQSRHSVSYLETRLELLEGYWSSYINKHEDILNLLKVTEQKDKYFTENYYNRAEDVYIELKTTIKESLLVLNNKNTVTPTTSVTEVTRNHVKLPPIQIPTFSGEYKDWTSFKELFTSIIHKDTQLTNIEKFHYLKTSLSGEPEQLVRHFSLIDTNYEMAWKTLEQRYNNPRIIVGTILKRFLTHRKITTENAKLLKDLLDNTNECLSSLKSQNIDTESWDPLVVHVVVSKLDTDSLKEWEQALGSTHELPSFSRLASFIEGRFRALEMVQSATFHSPKPQLNNSKPDQKKATNIKSFATEVETTCTYCSQSHYLSHCKAFTEIDISKRREFASNKGICFNCLVKGHTRKLCRQKTSCRICHKRHHTLLHEASSESTSVHDHEQAKTSAVSEPVTITTMKAEINYPVILATAKIQVEAANGTTYVLRALVDPGSQASFVTESVAQLLNLRRTKVLGKISGINNGIITSKSLVQFNIQSTHSEEKLLIKAYVLKSLTTLMPSHRFDITEWPILENLDLADPDLHKPSHIDILLGAEVHAQIIQQGLHKKGSLIAQNSTLGWLISGRADSDTDEQHTQVTVLHTQLLSQQLRRFWELEEPTHDEKPLSDLERECEHHFQTTHYRNQEGRYVVSLPFRKSFAERLGNSRSIATKRLLQMEQKFKCKPEFEIQYMKFMDEYLSLNHMEEVSPINDDSTPGYYLPHHAILRESSLTTKLRVVFDGSAKPTTGTALNDELLIGPPLQQDICDLVTRWRQHKICMVADVKQMYRQILVAPTDANYQRILWRTNSQDPMKEYRLRTVTYGTSCAPFLAIRTLKQLAKDEKANYPEACAVLETDFYMDDLLSGTTNENSAITLQKQLSDLLGRAGLELHKWASNSKALLRNIPTNKTLTDKAVTITMDSIKALGICWNPLNDAIELKLNVSPPQMPYTKTTVLSDIARIYDPLGWLGPTVVIAKIKKLWLLGLDWKDNLPENLLSEWSEYRNSLQEMEQIELPRWLGITNGDNIELHGFCDASTAAYAAVIYLRLVSDSGKSQTCMLVAKTRVAPVKQVSLPRLELCGAVLLSQLIKNVKRSLNIEDKCIYAWTDSTIVLCWLRKHPNTWKTFVANRTSEILNVLHYNQFQHIRSHDNPADCASRGLKPDQLKNCSLWWNGPPFLQQSGSIPRVIPDPDHTNLEIKLKVHLARDSDDWHISFLKNYSKLYRLIRVVAYCLRFKLHKEKLPNYLTSLELTNALFVCIKMSQMIYFMNEMECLSKNRPLSKSSKLLTLNPYLDDKGVLRVGGRICNAKIHVDSKNPIILSKECNLSSLIIENTHVNIALHGGPQLTLNLVRRKYWIIGAKFIIKRVIRTCLNCFRQTATPIIQRMGDLPSSRVTPLRAFKQSGVDFAGPVTLKFYPGRCKRTTKAYISLFVCMSSKAIHLELVSDLSSSAFLAAFRRFTARRGPCSDLWSDCGTNFVGAAKELNIMLKNSKYELSDELAELLANDHTTWHFVPPGSPNFGGLWEAGVKSVKTHLKRVIGSTLLTFEEYSTLLCQVETCVNSRPLTPLSLSPSDDLPLTPGHFLIGEAPIIIPDENVLRSPLTRWKLIQRMMQDLWKRWSLEYLTSLNQRYRWPSKMPEPDVGGVVLVVDERLPPGKWLLGRIVEKHPGKDGLTRVVTLKMKDKLFKRPVTKLCPLPLPL